MLNQTDNPKLIVFHDICFEIDLAKIRKKTSFFKLSAYFLEKFYHEQILIMPNFSTTHLPYKLQTRSFSNFISTLYQNNL